MTDHNQELVERVARAIALSDYPGEALRWPEDFGPGERKDYRDNARAAIVLCARLRDLDGAMSDPDAAARDFYGHVAPSLHRLEGYLAALAAHPKPEEG